ncbi:MAG TPA: LysR family transcriptional regulator [Gemmatimonadales bacterium]|nr:LysR family transcriptional regulator [Gemmatimonadales bacterium]
MSLRRFRLLVALADAGSVTGAARVAAISQPAFSQQLRLIERHYGFPLLMRAGRRLVLTRAARDLVDYARRIVRLADESERVARELVDLDSGRLTVGATGTVGTYLVPRVLAEYRRRYPAVELRLRMGRPADVERWVLAGEADVGVTGGSAGEPQAVVTPFRRDELVAVAAAGHPLATVARLDGAALAAQGLIVAEAESGSRQTLERALAAAGLQLRVLFELPSTEAILQAVAAGLGAAVVTALAVAQPPLALRLRVRRVAGLDLSRYLAVVKHPDVDPGPAAREFIALLERGVAPPTAPAA